MIPQMAPPETAALSQGYQYGNNNLYNFQHKGIFHPEPNSLRCSGNSCYKYADLYPILFGFSFGCSFIPKRIASNMIVLL